MERTHLPNDARPMQGDEMIRHIDTTNRVIKFLMLMTCIQYLFGMAMLGLF